MNVCVKSLPESGVNAMDVLGAELREKPNLQQPYNNRREPSELTSAESWWALVDDLRTFRHADLAAPLAYL
jgi:hypothetical protein